MSDKVVDLNIYDKVAPSWSRYPDGEGNSKVPANGCKAITFQNNGSAVAWLDNWQPILPGQIFGYGGGIGVHVVKVFNITYSAGTQNVLVTRLDYI